MRDPSSATTDLINTVNAHLQQLSVIATYQVLEAPLRVASTSLRYLLVEDMLAQAWRASGLGGPMTFRTKRIAQVDGDSAVAFCGGGEILPGQPASICWNATLADCILDLSALQRQVRIRVGDKKVSTNELIQYVANTLGGAHFDPEGKSPKSRKPAFDLLRQLDAEGFHGLNLKVNNRSLLHHEILSVMEAVLRSPEVQRLRLWYPHSP